MAHSPHINPYGIPLLDVGRDVHGRFTKANPGGPGNPFARKVAALRKALLDSVSEGQAGTFLGQRLWPWLRMLPLALARHHEDPEDGPG